MIRELNQELDSTNNTDQPYQDSLADGYTDKHLLPPKEEIDDILEENNIVKFEMTDLNELQIDYMEDFTDLIDQYRDDVETFAEKRSVKPPAYMAIAAKMGLAIKNKLDKRDRITLPIGFVSAHQISKRMNLSLRAIKKIKSFVETESKKLKENTPKTSKLWQSLLLYGVPYSSDLEKIEKNVKRVIKWADSQIKKLEKN